MIITSLSDKKSAAATVKKPRPKSAVADVEWDNNERYGHGYRAGNGVMGSGFGEMQDVKIDNLQKGKMWTDGGGHLQSRLQGAGVSMPAQYTQVRRGSVIGLLFDDPTGLRRPTVVGYAFGALRFRDNLLGLAVAG